MIQAWDALLDTGAHVAPVGGSDDHTAGEDEGQFASPIGDPTTLVYAANLSTPALVQAIREGRTVVKLQGPGDPMVIVTTADGHLLGDTVAGPTTLQVTITGGLGKQYRYVHNGSPTDSFEITSDPFTTTRAVGAPATGADRWRVEAMETDALNGLHPITVTGHIWIAPAPPRAKSGCAQPGGGPGLLIAGALAWASRRRSAARGGGGLRGTA